MIKQSCKGFTLIELMVVICLFGFLVTLALMNISFLDTTIVRTELDKLTTFCYYVQQKAIATNKEAVVTFDTTKHEYYSDKNREKLSSRVSFGFFDNAQGPPGQPVGPIKNAITFSGQRIHFYPTGIISSGTVYLIDKAKKSMYALSNAVSQLSYLRMYRFDGSWKLLIPGKCV